MMNLRVLINLILILASLTGCRTKSQVSVYYKFVPRGANLVDTINLTIYDNKQSFISKRTILCDSTFIDNRIFCQSDSLICSVKYKRIRNGNWIISFSNKWSLFFEILNDKLYPVEIFPDSIYIIPTELKIVSDDTIPNRIMRIGGTKLYGFGVHNSKLYLPENNITYWFHPDFGVIAMTSPSLNFVRNDFSSYVTKKYDQK